MIAVDTNILVHAHRRDATFHSEARQAVDDLVRQPANWGIAFHCLVELYGVITNPRIWRAPSTPEQAIDQIAAWCEIPNLVVLDDNPGTRDRLWQLASRGAIVGARVHDARIAAVCLENGVDPLWTIDRDFSRFPQLHVVNPLARPRPPTSQHPIDS